MFSLEFNKRIEEEESKKPVPIEIRAVVFPLSNTELFKTIDDLKKIVTSTIIESKMNVIILTGLSYLIPPESKAYNEFGEFLGGLEFYHGAHLKELLVLSTIPNGQITFEPNNKMNLNLITSHLGIKLRHSKETFSFMHAMTNYGSFLLKPFIDEYKRVNDLANRSIVGNFVFDEDIIDELEQFDMFDGRTTIEGSHIVSNGFKSSLVLSSSLVLFVKYCE